MLLLGACSTAEQVAPNDASQAGFVPSAPPENVADPPIVTAGNLVEEKTAAQTPVTPQSRDGAKAKASRSGFELSQSQVAALIAHSRAEFSGECPCPYDVDKSGRSCGKRSAYSMATAPVLCYPKDLAPQ
jgi:hypothetical protein